MKKVLKDFEKSFKKKRKKRKIYFILIHILIESKKYKKYNENKFNQLSTVQFVNDIISSSKY